MTSVLSRRTLLAVSGGMILCSAAFADENPFAKLERRGGGRLGVAALDTGSGERMGWRDGERFAMCSTFKLLAVAAVLNRVDRGKEHLDRRIDYGEDDLLDYAPVTRAHVGEGGMTLSALCAAAIEYSDNTAGNLLLRTLGGPEGLTYYTRTLGDTVTRLDRNEPSLNTAIPGDPRDTTTPSAMLADMRKLLLDGVLTGRSRQLLLSWLVASPTGKDLLRAGLPADWRIGGKTGRGGNRSVNDVAIVWLPARKPILIAAYYTGSTASDVERDAVLADVGRIVAAGFR